MKSAFVFFFIQIILMICISKKSTGAVRLLKENYFRDPVIKKTDTTHLKGNVSATGLIQTGNENRFVASLLSEILIGNRNYEILPLTSFAYSTKPHVQVEAEYLENVIIRYHQQHTFYPAVGLSFEKSLLRKIDYRYSAGFTMVVNLMNKNDQSIKLGIGVNREFTQYISGAFVPPINNNVYYNRDLNQVYIRLKGVNHFLKNSLVFSYDFFYQPNIQDFNDYRWTLISNLDIPLNKRLSFRASAVSSYESFVATKVSNNNFRLTYGINVLF